MKQISKERLAEFLSEILPDDIDLAITEVTLTIKPDELPNVVIHTAPCVESTHEIWNELQKLRAQNDRP